MTADKVSFSIDMHQLRSDNEIVKRAVAILVFFLTFAFCAPVFAQGLSGVANNLAIDDTEAGPGDILTVDAGKIVRATKPYDEGIVGVVVQFPVISLGQKADGVVSVLSSGKADVKVSTANGEIQVGDYITTSEQAGVGQKATIPGFVLGKALASYTDTSQDGTVPVLINIGVFAQNPNVSGLLGQLLNSLSIGLASTENFPLMLKYVSAAVIGAVTFILASVSFVRFMRSGIEAIGRNPLARTTIVAGMFLNGAIVLILAIAGFGIAFAIIAL